MDLPNILDIHGALEHSLKDSAISELIPSPPHIPLAIRPSQQLLLLQASICVRARTQTHPYRSLVIRIYLCY